MLFGPKYKTIFQPNPSNNFLKTQHRIPIRYYQDGLVRVNNSPVVFRGFEPRLQAGQRVPVTVKRHDGALGRVVIKDIQYEDVRLIDHWDIKREGYSDYADFVTTWMKAHDKAGAKAILDSADPDASTSLSVLRQIAHRPADPYFAWVICFRLDQNSLNKAHTLFDEIGYDPDLFQKSVEFEQAMPDTRRLHEPMVEQAFFEWLFPDQALTF